MYRTYRNLYRIRPSLSSIGIGKNRIKLPKGAEITIDMVILFVVFFFIALFLVVPLISPLLSLVLPINYPWLSALAISGATAHWASKQDPYGKPITEYLWGLFRYFLRSKIHDGWENLPRNRVGKVSLIRNTIRIAHLDDGKVGSLPAFGRATEFELRVSTAVKIKGGKVWFGRGAAFFNKRIFKPGHYRIVDGELQDFRPRIKPPLNIPRK